MVHRRAWQRLCKVSFWRLDNIRNGREHLRVKKTGTNATSRANRTAGRRPVMTPRMASGMSLRNDNQVKPVVDVRLSMFEIEVTAATIGVQNMIKPIARARLRIYLMTRSHHLLLKFFQMTSPGTIPVYLGDMCRG